MTTLDRAPLPLTGVARPAVAVRVMRAIAEVWKALRNRREIFRLGAMSATELADIGLTRADLHVAWRMPLRDDPTCHLGIVAQARATRELREAAERAARQAC